MFSLCWLSRHLLRLDIYLEKTMQLFFAFWEIISYGFFRWLNRKSKRQTRPVLQLDIKEISQLKYKPNSTLALYSSLNYFPVFYCIIFLPAMSLFFSRQHGCNCNVVLTDFYNIYSTFSHIPATLDINIHFYNLYFIVKHSTFPLYWLISSHE